MGSDIQNLIKTFFVLFLFCILLPLCSCSQNSPEISNVNYSIIYNYKNSESYPEARLSVLAQSETDIRRYDRIIIESEESDYIWDFDILQELKIDDVQYIGSTSLLIPEGEQFPIGTYEITCITADQKEKKIKFTLSYDNSFYELKEDEATQKAMEKNGRKKIAIYDKNNVLLYYGDRTADFQTTRDIWNYFRNAEYFQEIWLISGSRLICIMPVQNVVPEK